MQRVLTLQQILHFNLPPNPSSSRSQMQIAEKKRRSSRWRWLYQSRKSPPIPSASRHNHQTQPQAPPHSNHFQMAQSYQAEPQPQQYLVSGLSSISCRQSPGSYSFARATSLLCSSQYIKTGGRAVYEGRLASFHSITSRSFKIPPRPRSSRMQRMRLKCLLRSRTWSGFLLSSAPARQLVREVQIRGRMKRSQRCTTRPSR